MKKNKAFIALNVEQKKGFILDWGKSLGMIYLPAMTPYYEGKLVFADTEDYWITFYGTHFMAVIGENDFSYVYSEMTQEILKQIEESLLATIPGETISQTRTMQNKQNVVFSLKLEFDRSGMADIKIYCHRPKIEKELTYTFRAWRINGSKWILIDQSGTKEEYKTRKACVQRAKDIFKIP